MKRFLIICLSVYIGFLSVFLPYKNVQAVSIPFTVWGSETVIFYLASALGIGVGANYTYNHFDDLKQDAQILKESMVDAIEMNTTITEAQQDASVAMLDDMIEQATLTGNILIDKSSVLWKSLKDWSVSTFRTASPPDLKSLTYNSFFNEKAYSYFLSCGFPADRDYNIDLTDNTIGNWEFMAYGTKYISKYGSFQFFYSLGNTGQTFDDTSINYIIYRPDNYWDPFVTGTSSHVDLADYNVIYSTYPGKAINGLPTMANLEFDNRYADNVIDNWTIVNPKNVNVDSFAEDSVSITIPKNISIDNVSSIDVTDQVIPIDTVKAESIAISESDTVVSVKDLADSSAITDENTLSSTESEIKEKSKGLVDIFPFCIPFDLIHALKVFNAKPETPHFEIPLEIKSIDFSYTLVVDFEKFNSLAYICRMGFLISFIVGLILLTRTIIRG